MEKYIEISIVNDNLYLSYSEFEELVDKIKNSVPDEHKANATIKIVGQPWYEGDAIINISISYKREETPEEVRKRLNKEKAARIKKENEELETFRRLLAKYTTQT